jgi:hypothetical protein
MKKIILVGSYVGRCGSATIMRVLQRAGINIGNDRITFRAADKHNPYGYYDAWEQEKLIWQMFPEYKQFPLDPPADVQLFLNRAQPQVPALQGFFREYFDDKYPLAIKDIRYFFLAVLISCCNPAELRLIVLHRPLNNRLQSGYKMIEDGIGSITKPQLDHWASAWRDYEGQILSATLPVPRLHIRFDDLIQSPQTVLKRIGDFIDVPLDSYAHLVEPQLRHF